MPEAAVAGPVGLAGVWLLGVSMGMTACAVTCLPFLGTWALGRASGRAEAFAHTAVFLAGRMGAYTLLAALAGALGAGLARSLGGAGGNVAVGVASLLAGLWLLWRPDRPRRGGPGEAPIRFRRRDRLPPLFLGAALAVTPCTPLASLLVLAANAGSMAWGAACGLAFGLGAAVTPMLLLVPLAGRLGRELRSRRPWLARWLAWGAALVLVLLGLRRLWAAFGL